MSEERPPIVDEKSGEKEREKESEKSSGGDSFEEKARRDPLSAMFWAGFLILAGLIYLANNMNFLPQVGSAEAWDWIMVCGGGLLLLLAFIRSVSPDYARPVGGNVILGAILVAIGLGEIIDSDLIWPILLMVGGVLLLINAMRGRS